MSQSTVEAADELFASHSCAADEHFPFQIVRGGDESGGILYPKTIRVDRGSKFVRRDLDLWAYPKGVTLDFSRPGKPTDTDLRPYSPPV